MKNKKIEELIINHCIDCEHTCKYKGDDDILEEVLVECFEVEDKQFLSSHRWWNTYRKVIKIEDTYIGYIVAESTGDSGAKELGYEFDPDLICEMLPVEKTIITYVVRKE